MIALSQPPRRRRLHHVCGLGVVILAFAVLPVGATDDGAGKHRHLGKPSGGGGGGSGCTEDTTKYNFCLETVNFSRRDESTVTSYFQQAVSKWESVIIANLPSVSSAGLNTQYACSSVYPAIIDDMYVCASGEDIDGPYGVVGSAFVAYMRSSSKLPCVGGMRIDNADISYLGLQLYDVIVHEFGHLLGISGLFWGMHNLVVSGNYTGLNAIREWNAVGCAGTPPVESGGGAGTSGHHWDEDVLKNELMTGWINAGTGLQPLSKVTVGTLQDLGYGVNYANADAYAVPQCPDASTGRRVMRSLRLEDDRAEPRLLLRGGNDDGTRKLSAAGVAKAKAYGKSLLQKARSDQDHKIKSPGGQDPANVVFTADAFVDVIYYENGNLYGVEVTESDLEAP